MATLKTRSITITNSGVQGDGIPVELEPMDNGSRFRWGFFAVLAAIFVASLMDERIVYAGLFDTKSFLAGEYWRAITYAFLHGGWLHLIMNSLALLTFAKVCELHFGRKGWITIFLVTSVFAVIPEAIFRPELKMVGASGGLMGLWGAQLAAAIRLKEVPKSFRQISNQLSLGSLAIFFLVQATLDHLIPNIAWWAHLGGFFSGLALAMFLPLNGGATIYASRRGLVAVQSMTIHDVKGTVDMDRFQKVVLVLQAGFDAAKDFIVVEKDRLGFGDRRYSTVELVAGAMPAISSEAWTERETVANLTEIAGIGNVQTLIDGSDRAAVEAEAKKVGEAG